MFENDEVFGALANYQRRQLLVNLLHNDFQVVPELSPEAHEVLEADKALLSEFLSTSQGDATVDKAHIRLYYVHLPQLAEYGFITWDRETRVITKGPSFDDVKPLLELVDDHLKEPAATGTIVPLRR